MGRSPTFVANGHTNHDARITFFYRVRHQPADGVQDAGSRAGLPVGGQGCRRQYLRWRQEIQNASAAEHPGHWSVIVYDNGTRSELLNGTPFSRSSTFTKPKANSDGSIDLFFGPEIPAGQEANWIKTVPGKGWFFLFRLYGPEKAYFDRTWKPDDLVEIS